MAALMRLRVVQSAGDAYEVAMTPKLIVAVERQFAQPISTLFGESTSYEVLCWTAWKGAQASGRVVKPFDEWLDDIDAIEAAEEPRVPLENR